MRLFVAVELEDRARLAIDAERKRLMSAMGPAARDLRWVRTDHLHLTLVFLGEVVPSESRPIVEALEHDVEQKPYEIVFDSLGVFPPRGAPRTLWLGVVRGAQETIELQAIIVGRLASAYPSGRDGEPLANRPFTPHLTLARWRGRGGRSSISPIRQFRIKASTPVAHVTLFESRLSAAGPAYTALARARLTCPSA